MDKRTISFLFLLTVSFFFIHSFFSKKDEEKLQQNLAQQKAQQEQTTENLDRDFNYRTAHLDELPVTELYYDSARNEPATWATVADESYLTFNFNDELPKKLYTKDGDELSLAAQGAKNAPVLYSRSKKISIPSTYLPQIGSSDLQIVSLDNSGVSVTLGEYINSSVIFPKGAPNQNAIALYNAAGNYLPVGYYNAETKIFIDLPSDHHFENLLILAIPDIENLKANEEFYVLENDFQQIVFSNIGGSITEINLAFANNENKKSIVRPIQFDRTINEDYPQNDNFPNYPYSVADNNGTVSQRNPQKGGFYPLLRRNLKGADGASSFTVPPRFYALNILSDDPELANARYTVRRFTSDEIEFETQLSGRRISKTYKLPKEKYDVPYVLDVSLRVDGDSRGLWLSTGIPEVELISNAFTPTLKYRSSYGGKPKVEKVSLPKKESVIYGNVQPDWISNSNGFFTLMLDPLTQISSGIKAEMIPGNFDPSRLSIIDSQYDLYPASKYSGYNLLLPLNMTAQSQNFRFYAGPLERSVLKEVDAVYTDPVTGYNPDYKSAISFHGWFSFVSEPFSKFLFLLLNLFHGITNSWGFSIILLTFALRLMLYPLNAWSIKSNLRMQAIGPKVTALQQKYKKDPQRIQLETMQLYKEGGVNPFSGCLPLLIQMPFLIGMFDLLKSSFDLRGAPFIPGWIDNLAAPDVLFSWSRPIIFFGTTFHLLPILLGGTMFLQQKYMQAKNKGAVQTEQQKQTQTMGMMMTLVFTFMFYRFPSGLNLYWISSMALSIGQQAYMSKRLKDTPPSKKAQKA